MKTSFFVFLAMALFFANALSAQVAINTDNTPPDNSAMLDVKSTSKGMLIPRMTTAQRNAILSPAKGLMVFCTDKNQLYINNGTPAAPIWSTNLSIPFSDSFKYDGALLDLTNDSTGGAAMFSISNPDSYWPAVYAETYGPGWTIQSYNHGATDGFAGYFRNTSPTNNWPAIQGKTAGEGSVFRAYQNLGPGPGMDVFMMVPTSTAPGISVDQQGLGNAAQFIINNPSTTGNAIYAESNAGTTIFAHKTGGTENEAILAINSSSDGFGMQTLITNADNGWASFKAGTSGTGNAGEFGIFNTSSWADAIWTHTSGPGYALRAETTGSGNGIWSEAGSGEAMHLKNSSTWANTLVVENQGSSAALWATAGEGNALVAINESSTGEAIWAQNNGGSSAIGAMGTTGSAIYAFNTSAGSSTIWAENHGSGTALGGSAVEGHAIYAANSSSSSPAAWIQNNGTNKALEATAAGNTAIFAHKTGGSENEALLAINDANGGNGISSLISNGTNSGTAVFATTSGTGPAGRFEVQNPINDNPPVSAETFGTGNAGFFKINNSTNSNSAIYSETIGTGDGGFFLKNSPTGSTAALKGRSINSGGGAGVFEIFNASNFNASLYCVTQGTGSAGFFTVENTASTSASLFAETNGTGTSFIANHSGISGNIAIFRSGNTNKARIDKNGKGFFNGGTQTSGADLAEMFDVEGPVKNYEPGDVMVISELSDRTMEKSSTAVSTKVAGVYATKPGVILTELGIDENLDALIPVGVIGVIPTKVCNQNGPIRRGDLLVTSSIPGHAMKAIPVDIKGMLIYPTGAILGKALENFETGQTGMIRVLVNVK